MNIKQLYLELSDGNTIPQIGLGVWQASQDEARSAVCHALKSGYRHIDTAAIYKNEEGVGLGIKDSGLPRDEIFVTTKVWNDVQGFDATTAAIDASLERLGLDYVDMLLIHWPCPTQDLYVDTWKAMIHAKGQGKVRSIGISNFNPEHLEKLIKETGIKPVINQVELHPYFQRKELRESHAGLGVLTQAWSPLGQGQVLSDKVIAAIANKYGKTPAQIIIRWHLQLGNVVIPKSVTPSRIEENLNVFDFEIDSADMEQIATLEQGLRIGPDPLKFG
ncbi:oxidoreductase [Vibrio sp. HA2012]|uniref:aldo/keto reductase n=1 Tax=Vibrio sp. HA2012 TaxID=1971595 RepID=UPI000C2B7569|nr:aldo/keto reductase [Vibrio sp. HA2012]PJC86782.1 oxidoreductase [Vibrio sp. HA2012]